ncbi:class I SAM-dependent methyltransferase [Candidatus Micrarchaeota archaeon]|nr:class I SAM-dependent methyltransferase [Candidatus Micrarchaeota archaeon]
MPLFLKDAVLTPVIIEELGNIKGKRAVDLGCGSGYFSRKMVARGARVVGVDRNKHQLDLALRKSTRNIRYLKGDIIRTHLPAASFDLALLNLVNVEIPSTSTVIKVFKNTRGWLKRNGTLVIGDVHPHNLGKGSAADSFLPSSGKDYFDNGSKWHSESYRIDGKKLKFYPNYHYTIEFLVNTLIETGFRLERMHEIPYKNEGFPIGLVLVARKE